MHEIVKYFILTEIRSEIVNFRSRSDLGDFPRDLAHSRCMEQCMVADLSAGLGDTSCAGCYGSQTPVNLRGRSIGFRVRLLD